MQLAQAVGSNSSQLTQFRTEARQVWGTHFPERSIVSAGSKQTAHMVGVFSQHMAQRGSLAQVISVHTPLTNSLPAGQEMQVP